MKEIFNIANTKCMNDFFNNKFSINNKKKWISSNQKYFENLTNLLPKRMYSKVYMSTLQTKNEIALKQDLGKVDTKMSVGRKILSSVLSFCAGVINGFFGGGAGMLIVPILEKVNKLETKKAHATAVFVVLPLCIFSVISYLIIDKFSFENGWWVTLGVVIGGVIGAFLLKKLNAKYIRFIFALLVLGSGVKLFIDSIGFII